LLREIHHRVKNNLQIIPSLLYLQSSSIADGRAIEIFKESQNRIRSMALIHETLYRSGDLARIDLREYIQSVIKFLVTSYNVASRGIAFDVDIADISLSMDTAVPCGLIINELVSNSLKHAFTAGKGKLLIKFHQIGEDQFEIVVKDDGIGLPADFDIDTSPTLGLRLGKTLVRQIDGELETRRNGGTEFRIRFCEKAARRLVPCKL
ncbi:MAG TPA: sensor histidine kinase, partial [Firmicutes bacterium]|nr:sensor histidine kinase [Bacillota bacterium]